MRMIAILTLTAILFISPVFLSSGAFSETSSEAIEKAAPLMPFIKDAVWLYPGRFLLKKIGSRYLPESYYKRGLKYYFIHDVTIPGTEIRAKFFEYEYIDEKGKKKRTHKVSMLINDTIYYVENSNNRSMCCFDSTGGVNYGIYKDYFTIESCASGGRPCDNRIFLFRYTKDSVELLDVIMMSTDFDFTSDALDDPKNQKHGEWWMQIADIDNDGYPEMKVSISYDANFGKEAFKLFLEIKDNKLQVDFNPELYKPLFKEIERKSRNRKQKPDAYYAYGLFSGKLSLKKIKTMLAEKEGPGEKEHFIVRFLKSRDTWDAELHGNYRNKPVLIRHNLKRETGGK